FIAALSANVEGGSLIVDHDGLHVRDATAVTLYLAAGSDYANGVGDEEQSQKDQSRSRIDPKPRVMQLINDAMTQTYEENRTSHIGDYCRLFDRVELKLGSGLNASFEDKTTDERIRTFDGTDLELVELLLQYGRYLLIARSRPATLPANLQGIWNREMRAPW